MGHHALALPLLWLAGTTIRDDLAHGRIANRRLAIALGLGGALYMLLALLELAGAEPWLLAGAAPRGPWHWLVGVSLNLVLGLVSAIGLWLLGVWAAGDAKLFAVYAFLVPPACYVRSYLPGFPALALLVNVFVLVFLLLAADLARTGIPAAVKTLADPGRRRELARGAPAAIVRALPLLLAFTAMFAGIRALREASRDTLEPFLGVGDFTMFLLLFALFRPLARVFVTRPGAIVFSGLAVAALVFLGARHGVAALPGLVVPSAYAVVLLVFARAYPGIGPATARTRVGELRPGLMLAPTSLQRLRTREEQELAELGDSAPEPEDEPPGTTPRPTRLGAVTADGLTAEQIRYIRTRYNDDEPIEVARTLPFSPLLAGGAAVTYLVGGPLTMYLTIG